MATKRIIVVDDDLDLLMTLKEVLRCEGYETEAADGWYSLLRLLNHAPLPHVIILDVSLPQFSGIELLETLKRCPKYRTIPVVVVTALGSKMRTRAFQAGAASFIEKPIDLADLLGAIREVTTPSYADFSIET